MNSPEREEVAKQLAEEFGFEAWPDSRWSRMVKDIGHYLGEKREWLPNDVRDALISGEMQVRMLEQKVAELKAGCNCELPWTGEIPQPICAVHPIRHALNSKK